jgi:hypothetical protein
MIHLKKWNKRNLFALSAVVVFAVTLAGCQTTAERGPENVSHTFAGADVAKAKGAILAHMQSKGYSLESSSDVGMVLDDPTAGPVTVAQLMETCNSCPAARWQAAFTFAQLGRDTLVSVRPQQLLNRGTPIQRVIPHFYSPTTAAQLAIDLKTASKLVSR